MTNSPLPADGSGYFLYHSIGHYPGKAADMEAAMAEYAALWGRFDDSQWPAVLPLKQRFIDNWAKLINAPADTVTTAENVTVALYSLIGGLPAQYLRGKRVLVAEDCFPSLHFMLAGIADRFGFTLDTVRMRQGAAWVEDSDMIAQWGDDVGLALLTWVTSTASHRCNLDALVAHARAKGSLVGVDITQAAGLLPYDVTSPTVDFTLSTSLKWLCGASGAGILQVARPLLENCSPELRGWFSQPNPFSWDLDAFSYAPDSRRFDHGTPAIPALAASNPALEWNLAQPDGKLLSHNRSLTGALIEMADHLHLPLVTPRNEAERGGSIMVRCPSAEGAARAVDRLRDQGLFTDARGSILRLSPGICTTSQGVDRLAARLAEALG